MKMVIVEIKKNIAVALQDDGTFVKIRQQGYRIGQTIELASTQKVSQRISHIAAACVVAFILLGGSGALAVQMPYSYVMLDVNPSIKYTLNVFDRVLSVEALNKDADAIVDNLELEDISYERLDDVIEKTIAQCRSDGYLNEDTEDYVVLSVTSVSDDKTSQLSDQLSESDFGGGMISVKVVPTTIDDMEDAEKLETTPGKLEIISEMQEQTGDTQDAEKWIDVPVRNIIMTTTSTDNSTQQNVSTEKNTFPPDYSMSKPQDAQPPENLQMRQDIQQVLNLQQPQDTEMQKDTQVPQETQMPQDAQIPPDIEMSQDKQMPQNIQQQDTQQEPADTSTFAPATTPPDVSESPTPPKPFDGTVQLSPPEGGERERQEPQPREAPPSP